METVPKFNRTPDILVLELATVVLLFLTEQLRRFSAEAKERKQTQQRNPVRNLSYYLEKHHMEKRRKNENMHLFYSSKIMQSTPV